MFKTLSLRYKNNKDLLALEDIIKHKIFNFKIINNQFSTKNLNK